MGGSDVSAMSGPPLSKAGDTQVQFTAKFESFIAVLKDIYHPQTNPNGIVNIGVAENSLMHEELTEFFEQNFRLIPQDYTYGDGITGSKRLTAALCALFNSRFNAHKPVTPEHLVCGAGLSPLMSQLTRVLCNPGEGILLCAPYYQGFDIDLGVQNSVYAVGVSMPQADLLTIKELEHLEKGLEESNAKGVTIRAVILCHPHNPLGRCYPREVLIEYCKFCEKHNLHLISDEIYALSVFPSNDVPNPEPFVSTLSLDLASIGVNPKRLHVVYGMSKDFNANGFRAGVLVTQYNTEIIKAVTATVMFMIIASPTDILWTALLNEQKYLQNFIETNQLKLREAYEYLTAFLKHHKIPYIPSNAGHFLLVDLTPVLSDLTRYGPILGLKAEQSMRERETVLAGFLIKHKIMVIPGLMCHAEPGWYRFTFSVRRDYMDIALKRIEEAMKWDSWQ